MGVSAPPAGTAPNGKPSAVPRSHGFQERPQSSRPMKARPTGMTSTGFRRRCAAIHSASPIAKIPTATTTMSMPSASWRMPPVSRACPVERSRPTSPIVRPIASPMNPRSLEEPNTAVTRTRASSIIAKNEGAPILTACSASDGVKKATRRVPIVPAMNEPIAAVARAWAARPFLAILLPSIAVITDADSPGVFSRIEVVEPPYMPP